MTLSIRKVFFISLLGTHIDSVAYRPTFYHPFGEGSSYVDVVAEHSVHWSVGEGILLGHG